MQASPYLPRIVDLVLDELLPAVPAIALEGAKGVGKTETARRRANRELRLDDSDVRQIVQADPTRALVGDGVILLDEWQRIPELWDRVRRAVDDRNPAGPFLLTGSATPIDVALHSGTGRIMGLRMRPFSLYERRLTTATVSLTELLTGRRGDLAGRSPLTLEDYTHEIVRSGFPGIMDAPPRARRARLDAYLDRIAERDFVELGHRVRSPQTLRRWMIAYAAATATCASFETIRDAATGDEGDKPSRATTIPYRDTLERLFLLDEVPGWRPGGRPISRIAVAPRHHLADPALAARLVGATSESLLEGQADGPAIPRDGTLLGALFESLVTLSIRVLADAAEARVFHLRTQQGEREVDLIVERADGRVLAIEVKLGSTPDDDDVRHLRWLQKRLGERLLDAIVITTGTESYRRTDGIGVIPAALLGP